VPPFTSGRTACSGRNRDAEADLDHPLHHLHVVELRHVARIDAVLAEHAIGLAPRRDVAVEADERLAGEPVRRDRAMLRERVRRRHHEHQAVLAERDDGDAGAAVRIRDDAEVDAALERVLVDLARRL
jgi:hypothetical protein